MQPTYIHTYIIIVALDKAFCIHSRLNATCAVTDSSLSECVYFILSLNHLARGLPSYTLYVMYTHVENGPSHTHPSIETSLHIRLFVLLGPASLFVHEQILEAMKLVRCGCRS